MNNDIIEHNGITYKKSHIVTHWYISKEGRIISLNKDGTYSFTTTYRTYNKNKYPLAILVNLPKPYYRTVNLGKLILDAYDVEQTLDDRSKLRTEVDHIDRNTFNNSLDNLRWATRRENCRNRNYDNITNYTWITDGIINRRINANDSLPFGFRYGKSINKVVYKCS